MAFLTFRGGVHPYDGKELSKEKPITDYAPGKELVYHYPSTLVLRQNRSLRKETMFWRGR